MAESADGVMMNPAAHASAATPAIPATVAPARRDFLKILTVSTAAIGAATLAWPLIDALNPDEAQNAVAHLIVNVGGIAENAALAITWAGLPIYIRKLTAKQIADNEFVVTDTLIDPEDYTARVKPGYETFVVVVGLNTGIPCQLLGNDPADPRGPFDGWLCPCDGSVYDPLGRVRTGPATRNLKIPRFTFLNATQIQFG
jgi:ubiquinol-cytochrome c reductase iron-sulfur subunit